jgi:serine/threonine-protein kinase
VSAQILPGDQLWNRYRVEQVDADGWEAAWLAPLERTPTTPPRYLMIPLDGRSNHPLAPLLMALCTSTRVKPPLTEQNGSGTGRLLRAASRRAPTRQLSSTAFETYPLLGSIEWIGDVGHGGVAVVAAPPVTPFSELVKHTPLSAAQTLPIFIDLARSLDALLTTVSSGSNRPATYEELLITAAHMLNPDNLGLRQGDAHLALKAGLAKNSPAHWPEWTDCIAPELFSESEPTAAAWVFSAARIAGFLLGCRSDEADFETAGGDPSGRSVPRDAAAWAALAAWASGKRDPAKEFLHSAKECGVPPELCDVLVRSLAKRPNRRPANPGKLLSALKRLTECAWAKNAYTCPGCGRNLTPIQVDRETLNCPGCGRDLPVPGGPPKIEPERGAGTSSSRPSGRRGSTALYKGRSGSTSAALSAVAAPTGMVLIAGGSFLSGERKIPRTLRPFAIDTTPVTEGEYKKFLSEISATPRAGGPGSRSARYDRHPVTQITWYEANEFAEHYSKRLPTIYEWEKAARGADGRRFPYGNTFKTGCGRLRAGGEGATETERRTIAVGSFPDGASPFGVMDMAGNVLEWTSTARRAGERLFRAVKGACYLDGSPELARCTSVQYIRPECSEQYLGFRCVKDLE